MATSSKKSLLNGFLTIIATLSVSICLIGVGLMACLAPITTEQLARHFSNETNSPFSQEQLVEAAEAVRDFTVSGDNLEELYETIYDINLAGESAQELFALIEPFLPEGVQPTTEVLKKAFDAASDVYGLGTDVVDHLSDVNEVLTRVTYLLYGVGALGLFCLLVLGIRGGRRAVGSPLFFGAVFVLLLFAVIALWAVVDFNGFFAFLHSLFFAEGTWVFPADSLLITLFPLEFWMGMGAVWLATVLVCCLLCMIAGTMLCRSKKNP